MKYNDIISVAGIRVATYDRSSRLAHEKPGEELFNETDDLKQLGHTDHVAALITFCNELAYKSTPRCLDIDLTVNLVDTDLGCTVASRSLSLHMTRREYLFRDRMDFPVELSREKLMHNFRLEICVPDGEVIALKLFRIYNLTRLKILPTKFFRCVAGAVTPYFEPRYTPMKSPGASALSESVNVRFTLESQLPQEVETPSLEMRIVGPDGGEEIRCLTPRPVDESSSDAHIGMLHATVRLDPEFTSPAGAWYAELRCMGYSFAAILFSTEGDAVSGEWTGDELRPCDNYTLAEGEARLRRQIAESSPAKLPQEDSTPGASRPREADIDDLIGLRSVKARLEEYTSMVRFNRLRSKAGMPETGLPLHAMFMGSPGTGKTTVAKIIGRRLHDIGVLSSGHVVMRERANLLGQYYHSEAENVMKALEEARGGILFIDEAYQLYQPHDPKDPGRFVIESLLTALADDSNRDWMLILAGYTGPMTRMFEMNPGLRSRIPRSNIYTFEDFDEGELMEIARRHLDRYRFRLDPAAETALIHRLKTDYASRGKDFGNARHVVNLIECDILPAMAMRLNTVAEPDADALSLILPADIPAPAPQIVMARPRLGFAV